MGEGTRAASPVAFHAWSQYCNRYVLTPSFLLLPLLPKCLLSQPCEGAPLSRGCWVLCLEALELTGTPLMWEITTRRRHRAPVLLGVVPHSRQEREARRSEPSH